MNKTVNGAVLVLSLVLAAPAVARAQAVPRTASPEAQLEALARPQIRETSGTLFENVAKVLAANYVDKEFRAKELPSLVEQYRPKAAAAASLLEQRQVVQDFLSHIPASHLGLLSAGTHRTMMADLLQVAYPSFGFQVIGTGASAYAAMVLEGGPAARAGLLAGDRLVTIDGTPVEESPRLDWRSDDAYIADERDPSVRRVIASDADRIALRVERRPGEFVNVTIAAEDYTAFDAAEASVRIIRSGGVSIGYVHFWYVHMAGVPDLIKHALAGRLKNVDALIVDLRGRGGSGNEVKAIVDAVADVGRKTSRPVVALADRQSRSAKDILAYEFKKHGIRIVGEATAGAVIPASFADVGHDSVLMFPTMKLDKYTDLLELKPTQPDVLVERAGMFAAGVDPIVEAGVAEARRLVKAGK
ncbi:MAG TPA: S41 family peptidase [Vicinamibacterales bacterium]|nr:S41 family peptidase [Vicinamibacterales bacterium]